MLKARAVTKYFGQIKALDAITFTAKKGEVITLLGPNGAGKTTLIRTMTGYIEPDSGYIHILGKNPIEHHVEILQKVGYVPENNPLYNELTVFEFLSFIASLKPNSNIRFAVEQLDLKKVITQRIETLSKGYRKRVGIAAAIIDKPEILLLDEPTEGLDPTQKSTIRDFIKNYASDKLVIISTHVMEEVEAVASSVLVLDQGKLIAALTLSEFKNLTSEGNMQASFLKLMEKKNA